MNNMTFDEAHVFLRDHVFKLFYLARESIYEKSPDMKRTLELWCNILTHISLEEGVRVVDAMATAEIPKPEYWDYPIFPTVIVGHAKRLRGISIGKMHTKNVLAEIMHGHTHTPAELARIRISSNGNSANGAL